MKIQPDLRVLFTLGYTENSIVHSGRLDAVELLSKLHDRDRLVAKVRRVLVALGHEKDGRSESREPAAV
jgi:hypothetical protein